jgi:hypothetical protein
MQDSVSAEAPLEHLQCRIEEEWVPLPHWARFMLQSGAASARTRTESCRLVIALSVPTRSFAAALAAAAAVGASFLEVPTERDSAAHFRYLAAQDPGTAVTHLRGDSLEQGTLLGVRDGTVDGKPRLEVKLHQETILLPEKLCDRIQVIADPGALSTRPRKLVRAPEFLERALPGANIPSLSAITRADCVVVGVKRLLEYEFTAERFAVLEDEIPYEGHLQSIVRAREFGGQNDPYRSMVIAASADGDAQLPVSPPRTAVFDGAPAFTNWRSAFPSSNWVVIIDRSSPSAETGAAAINQTYAMRAAEASELFEFPVPAGVEVLAYVDQL